MVYGDVTLRDGFWWVRCEPHVRARLKRVFPRAPQQAGEFVQLSDTPENARELDWFLQRYPMTIREPKALRASVKQHRDQELRLAELMAMRAPPLKIEMAKPPRDYQTVVPQYLAVKRGLLLGDDVGVGKTVSSFCCMLQPDSLPVVVVMAPHLRRQWRDKLREFVPGLSWHIIRKGKPYDLVSTKKAPWRNGMPIDGRRPGEVPNVILITYHMLRGWADILAELCRFVVFEECQQLRNPGTSIYIACSHVANKARYRLGLSATPIYNYGDEFYWVLDALQPGALGTREEFMREWCGTNARLNDAVQFGAYLRREGIMLRRTRKDVGRELPPVTKVVHAIDADAAVIEKMTTEAVDLAQAILRRAERFQGERMHASAEFDMIMRQATGVAKAPYVAAFVRMLIESGESVVLFGWHKAVYRIWRELLAEFNPAFFTGAQSPRQKEEAKRAFMEKRTPLLIMSLRAGAGTDGLQAVCRTAVVGELDWSQGIHTQCIGRVDRDGQPDPVTAYFLVAEEGSDPIVSEVCGVKREQIEPVMNPDAPMLERIDTGHNNLRQLARAFLKQRGIEAPAEREPEPINA